MAERIELKLFGSPQITYQGQPLTGFVSAKVRALLIYLAVTARPHSRDHLAHLLWEDMPGSMKANLRKALSNLRQLLGDLLVKEGKELIALDGQRCWVDVVEFERLLKSADLPEAAQLYTADFLTGFNPSLSYEFEAWTLREQSRLKSQMVDLLRKLAAQQETRHTLPEAIQTVRRLLDLEPWQEESHRWLMTLLAKDDQRSAALAHFEVCKRVLQAELAVEPAAETLALLAQIRQQPLPPSPSRLRQQTLLTWLPLPTYNQLFAAERHIAQLAAQLLQPDPPWLVAIEGMGGMGKTALADALTRHLIAQDRWEAVAWVTAQARVLNLGGGIKATPMPALTVEGMVEAIFAQLWPGPAPGGMSYDGRRHALTTRLKSAPHLLVIDNLETMLDVESLLATLRGWVNPSKILLTTRQRLLSEADIFHFDLPELGEADALRLVRAEAQNRNLPALLAASASDLHPIYAAVGGNPLALRLVVGQLHAHPLDTVLADLKAASGQPIANLYTYIYRQAWDNLNEGQRQALLVMLLTAEQGETLAQLCTFAAGQLAAEELRAAIEHLLAFSLIDARGGLHERRYTIHSLTRSFLHRQVMKRQE